MVVRRRKSASNAHRMPLAGLSLVQTNVVCEEDSMRCCQCSCENTDERLLSSHEAQASGSSPPHSQRRCRRSSLCISVLYPNSAVTAGTTVRLLLYPINNLDHAPQALHVWAKLAALGASKDEFEPSPGMPGLVACLCAQSARLIEIVPMRLAMALTGAQGAERYVKDDYMCLCVVRAMKSRAQGAWASSTHV